MAALGFALWATYQRAQRVEYVTQTDNDDAVVDPTSATGYAGGWRWLIVPEHNNRSYTWVAQTQQMAARREWRIRHVADENAPFGHPVLSPSPYRWWLGFSGWCDHVFSRRSMGLAIEHAALWADPVLFVLGMVVTILFTAWRFGAHAAAIAALGLATFFPLAATFLPGVPDDTGVSRLFALWSVLAVLAGVRSGSRLALAVGGVLGGMMLWLNTASALTTLLGIGAGGLALVLLGAIRSGRVHLAVGATPTGLAPLPWRMWSLAGALTCLAAYLIEYFPGHLEFELRENHPLYGIAWLGLGEVLMWFQEFAFDRRSALRASGLGRVVAGVLATSVVPVAFVMTRLPSPWRLDPYAGRLNFLPNGVVAPNFLTWIARAGLNETVIVTLLPLVTVAPVAWLLLRRRVSGNDRRTLLMGIAIVVVGLIAATRQLTWWSLVDAELVALAVAAVSMLRISEHRGRIWWACLFVPVALWGAVELRPLPTDNGRIEFTRLEVEGLVERGLAHWLSAHAEPGPAVILVPPDRTASWCFFGGLQGIGSSNWENRDGIAATVKMVTATTEAEAEALMREHRVTYLVLPSWDTDLDQFARWSLRNPEDAFVSALHHWALPPWLSAVPYRLPTIAGFEDHSVVIFRVTENASQAVGLARLAEYFVEMQQPDFAAWLDKSLDRFPADLSCLVARAEIAKLLDDRAGLARAIDAITTSVNGGFDRTMGWDRRVSLAIVLALADRNDLARAQLQRCIKTIDASRIRSLTTASLFRLLLLSKAYGMPISDPQQDALARSLLPAELRARL